MRQEIALPNRIRLCFSALRYYPITLRVELRRRGLWEDLEQELHLAAWEAEREGLNEHDTCLLASRRILAFLKACGYHRIHRHGHRNLCKEEPFSSVEFLEETLPDKGDLDA